MDVSGAVINGCPKKGETIREYAPDVKVPIGIYLKENTKRWEIDENYKAFKNRI